MKNLTLKAAVILLAALLLSIPALAQDPCSDPVDTAQGAVTGKEAKDVDSCAWLGIPYAAPPIGDLRWKAPEPPPARESALEAFEYGHRCVSGGSGSGAPKVMLPKQSEDCLFLNVWRPRKSGTFPVMVWIHGGSLSVGTAAEPIYYGARLAADEDVVVVSINYRLNYYGFLAHPALAGEDPNNSTGNYGLLDQVAALKWVKANVAAFGGDAENVTIFGESAGGWSVCNLLATPLARGLFDKAILQSGGCDTVRTLEDGYATGGQFAGDLGCPGDDVLACMRSMTPKQMEKALKKAARRRERTEEKKGFDLESMMDFKWVPHIDGYAFETTPIEALRTGRFNRVPFMVGSNRDEVKLFAIAVPGIRLVPKALLGPFLEGMFGGDTARRIEELYPYADYRRPVDALIDAFGDMALGCKCYEAADAVAGYEQVYYYRFDYDNHLAPHLVGAAHGFEIPFVFGTLDKFPAGLLIPPCKGKKAAELSEAMMGYWAAFARSGDPDGEGAASWPAFDRQAIMRMTLDLPLEALPADNVEKCEFWREVDMTLAP